MEKNFLKTSLDAPVIRWFLTQVNRMGVECSTSVNRQVTAFLKRPLVEFQPGNICISVKYGETEQESPTKKLYLNVSEKLIGLTAEEQVHYSWEPKTQMLDFCVNQYMGKEMKFSRGQIIGILIVEFLHASITLYRNKDKTVGFLQYKWDHSTEAGESIKSDLSLGIEVLVVSGPPLQLTFERFLDHELITKNKDRRTQIVVPGLDPKLSQFQVEPESKS